MKKLLSITLVILVGCVPPAVTKYSFLLSAKPDVSKASVTAVAVQVLTESGFVIQIINDNTGYVATDWKDVSSKQGQMGSYMMLGMATAHLMRISVTLNSTTGKIIVLPDYQEGTQSMYGQRGAPTPATLKDNDLAYARRLAEEIAGKLGIAPDGIEVVTKVENQ